MRKDRNSLLFRENDREPSSAFAASPARNTRGSPASHAGAYPGVLPESRRSRAQVEQGPVRAGCAVNRASFKPPVAQIGGTPFAQWRVGRSQRGIPLQPRHLRAHIRVPQGTHARPGGPVDGSDWTRKGIISSANGLVTAIGRDGRRRPLPGTP